MIKVDGTEKIHAWLTYSNSFPIFFLFADWDSFDQDVKTKDNRTTAEMRKKMRIPHKYLIWWIKGVLLLFINGNVNGKKQVVC